MLAGISLYGDLDEVEFLSRLYDLGGLPSEDSRFDDAAGDIRRHRIANFDWDDTWIFSDDRFGLRNGTDRGCSFSLSQSWHPEVEETLRRPGGSSGMSTLTSDVDGVGARSRGYPHGLITRGWLPR